MDDNYYLINEIRETIKNSVRPCYENTARTHIYCRCPKCGDSKRNKNSAHFYIKMEPPFLFSCQKCRYSGVLNTKVLESLNIFNNDLVLNINKANKSIKGRNNYLLNTSAEKKIYKDTSDDVTKISLDYFNNRFGTEFTLEEVNEKFKCVLNPENYFKYRKTVTMNKKFDYSKAIGFLSSDNSYIICRDTSGTQELRYSNSSLTNDLEKSKIYNIRTDVDWMCEKVKLVVTEGIFDSIGIYLKKFKNSKNVIVAAGCGKSFAEVITKFISMGFLDLDVEIYSDSDVDVLFYKEMKKSLYFLKDKPLTIYYNTLEKDCGVKADRINLRKVVI